MNTNPTARAQYVTTTGSVLYDAFGAGAIGGSIVALFFLAIDSLHGHPFYTPSLMGSVLFGGVAAEAVSDVRMDMAAYFTLVHFVVFGLVGLGVSVLLRQIELHSRHPVLLLVTLFVLMEALFVVAAALVMPGVVAAVGAGWVILANLLAASGMALFLLAQHRPDLWFRVKHAVHLA